MTVAQSLIAFTLAAGLLTLTPGLDTAIVLRTAAVEGARRAALAALGVIIGCLAWGAAVALGLGALLQASALAFEILRWAGAAYLAWLAVGLILKPRARFDLAADVTAPQGGELTWLRRGLLTNLLNPKVGVFYISFLPQFLPAGVPTGPYIFGLAALHGVLGLAWFAVLIGATRPVSDLLRRDGVVRWLDRVTGGVFLAFAARLALAPR